MEACRLAFRLELVYDFPVMGAILGIANQKGGVGKTTTAVNLSACLSSLGKKVLLIDLDPQANATSGLGRTASENGGPGGTVYEALIGQCSMREAVEPSEPKGLWLVPSTDDLSGAEIELLDLPGREYKLRDALKGMAEEYDFVIIDCPPALSILTLNALVASERVIIPLQCEYFALEGLGKLLRTLGLVRERLNQGLKMEGIVLTMFDARNNLSRQVRDEVKKHFAGKVFDSVIPRNVRLGEAPSHGLPIIMYDPVCAGAKAYESLAAEFLARMEGREASNGS